MLCEPQGEAYSILEYKGTWGCVVSATLIAPEFVLFPIKYSTITALQQLIKCCYVYRPGGVHAHVGSERARALETKVQKICIICHH
jgi:hypothetical protein